MIRSDKDMLWAPARIFIPVSAFTGLIGAAGVSAGVGVGAPVQQEVSTLETVGVLMDTAGDELSHLMALPADLDRRHPVYTRVHFTTGSATAADTIEWLVRYLKIVPNTTTLISAATAQDTDIASMTVTGTAYSYQVTGWGAILPAITAIADNVEVIYWEVELQAFAAGLTEDKLLLGLEIEYTPKRLASNPGMPHRAKRKTNMLGDVYAN